MSTSPQDSRPNDLAAKVDDLLRRIDTIERVLNLQPPAPAPAAPPDPGPPAPIAPLAPIAFEVEPLPAVLFESPRSPSPSPAAPPTAPSIAPPISSPLAPPNAPPAAPPFSPPRAARIAAPVAARPTTTSSSPAFSLEQLVGGRLYAAIGALILVIGVGLFLKLAIDRGWFSFPPAFRCTGAALLGIILIALGQFTRSRLRAHAEYIAAGLQAAGLGTIYASILAARAMYNLIPTSGAFILLALVSALGIVLALRSASLVLALLALAGAYLNPLVVGSSNASPLVLPSYLLALLVLGLALAALRPRPFRYLRFPTIGAHLLITLVWLVFTRAEHQWIALALLAVTWIIVHAELFLGSHRLSEAAPLTGSAHAPTLAPTLRSSHSSAITTRLALPLICSIIVTTFCAGAGVLTLQAAQSPVIPDWFVPAAGFVATFLLGLLFAGHLRVLRDPPETDAQRLGVAQLAVAGALLIAAIALALSGWPQLVAWLAMGLAAAFAARWTRTPALAAYGALILIIATARVLLYDSWSGPGAGFGSFSPPLPTALGFTLSRWSILMLATGASWIAFALLNRRDTLTAESSSRRVIVDLSLALGLTLALAGFAAQGTLSSARIVLIAILTVLLALAARWRLSLMLAAFSACAFLACTTHFAGAYCMPPLADWDEFKGPVAAHPGLLISVLCTIGAVIAIVMLRAPQDFRARAQLPRLLLIALASSLLFSATSLEIARSAALLTSDRTAQGAAVSIYWALIALVMVILGFARRIPPIRHIALALLGVSAVKTVIFDLADVAPEWRVASFIAVGLLMLAVAFAYARVAARFKSDQPPAADPTSPPRP